MNMKNQEYWDQLRTAYRPEAPALDVASIMDAVRREAAAQPLRRVPPGLAGPIPAWACTAAGPAHAGCSRRPPRPCWPFSRPASSWAVP